MYPIIRSILDTDQYKLSMGCAVLFGSRMGIAYSDCDVTYEFINRGGTQFPERFAEELRKEVDTMASLYLTDDEYTFLSENCPFLRSAYLEYLRGYRFKPHQVIISQNGGELRIQVVGPMYQAILWEVPLMATVSELYYWMTGRVADERTFARMEDKSKNLGNAGVLVGDFGTRRRFSYEVQDKSIPIFKENCPSYTGTSNLHLAMKHGVKPLGTQAHEWYSFHAALFGYRLANYHAMEAWVDEFQGDLGVALPDTFTTDVFLRDFGKKFASLFMAVRHDSGCPITFAEKFIAHYEKLGIDPMSKYILFSDSLNDSKAIELKRWCEGKVKFGLSGIGTFLTNDCGHNPLNMVIKLTEVRYRGQKIKAVKLSDVAGKHTGDREEIEVCKKVLGLS